MARHDSTNSIKSKIRRPVAITILLLVAIALFGFSCRFLATKKGSNDRAASSSTSFTSSRKNPTTFRTSSDGVVHYKSLTTTNIRALSSYSQDEQAILALLPNYTAEAILLDNISAQALAFDWMLEDIKANDKTLPNWRIQQRFALATLYFATNGADWKNNTNWLYHDVHECEWHSSMWPYGDGNPCTQIVDDTLVTNETYIQLQLLENRLNGTFPPEISLLSDLKKIRISSNPNLPYKLSGSLPSQIGQLSSLYHIDLSGHIFAASLPSQLGQLSSLVDLYLSFNFFTGTIPSELMQLPLLHTMVLDNNSLTSNIPSEIGLQRQLFTCYLANNALTGTIPSQVGQMPNLHELDLSNNSLTGHIPTEIGYAQSMSYLKLQSNKLTGCIPSQAGHWSLLYYMDLSSNSLSSSIPSELGNLSALYELNLSNNYLSGTVPSELGNLLSGSSASRLNLQNNSFFGTVPDTLCSARAYGLIYFLQFDCNDQLCGCGPDVCPCSETTTATPTIDVALARRRDPSP